MAKRQALSVRLAVVMLGMILIGFGGVYFWIGHRPGNTMIGHRGDMGSTCFNFRAMTRVDVPSGNPIHVSAQPLDRGSIGEIIAGDRVWAEQVCESTSGTDYKIGVGDLEGYVPAQLLIPGSLVPGDRITVPVKAGIYQSLTYPSNGDAPTLWAGGDAIIVEGPATAEGGFNGYKIRTLDPSI